MEARSSGGEHYLDAVGVGGSNPPVPTIAVFMEAPFSEEMPLFFFLRYPQWTGEVAE